MDFTSLQADLKKWKLKIREIAPTGGIIMNHISIPTNIVSMGTVLDNISK